MKKLLMLLTVCITLTSCNSAGTKTDSNSTPAPENSVSDDNVSAVSEINSPDKIKEELLQMTNCYKKQDFTLPDDMMDISYTFKLNDGNIIIIGNTKDNYDDTVIYKTDSSFSQFTPFSYSIPVEAETYDIVYDNPYFNPDGSFNVIVIMEDHGGITAPDEFDENFDYESYYNNCITSYMICTYDKDGNLLTSSPFSYPDELYDEYGSVPCGLPIADSDSIIQSFDDGSIRRISSTGEFTTIYEIENPEEYSYTMPSNFYRDRDGKIICMMRETKETVDSNGYSYPETIVNLRELTEKGVSDEILFSNKEHIFNSSPVFGRGDYRLFLPSYDGLIGIKDDGSTDMVIDWLASGMESMSVIPCGESDFIGNGYDNQGAFTVKLIPRDMSELANVEIITISNCDTRIISEFNNSNDKYRAELIEYPYDDNNSKLNMDIIAGEAPDIICGLDYSTYLNYRNKGLFTDLYQFMDSDSELNKDMFMPNIITALESSDGRLNAVCPSFDLQTLVTKTKFCNKENWTFNDMLNLYDNAPDSAIHLYDGSSKIDMFRAMFSAMNDLIDYENTTCDFNNPEFIQMLEFCNRFVDDVDSPEKWDDYEAFSQYNADKFRWLGNDQILIEPLRFYNPSQYNLLKYIQGGGEDLTIVGYPSNNGKGGRVLPESLMSITEKCENKQGAWEFLKFYILESNEIPEDSNGYAYVEGIPSLTASFEKAMKIEMNSKHSSSGEEFPAYTQEESDMISAYIKSCDSIGTVLDDDIVAVCEEEAGLYFAGEQSAEKSAENIQNRVSILVSERN